MDWIILIKDRRIGGPDCSSDCVTVDEAAVTTAADAPITTTMTLSLEKRKPSIL